MKKKTQFTGCVFVGDGQEDIRDIIKEEFIKHLNEEKGYLYVTIGEKVTSSHK